MKVGEKKQIQVANVGENIEDSLSGVEVRLKKALALSGLLAMYLLGGGEDEVKTVARKANAGLLDDWSARLLEINLGFDVVCGNLERIAYEVVLLNEKGNCGGAKDLECLDLLDLLREVKLGSKKAGKVKKKCL